jgi:hypothetical protein
MHNQVVRRLIVALQGLKKTLGSTEVVFACRALCTKDPRYDGRLEGYTPDAWVRREEVE